MDKRVRENIPRAGWDWKYTQVRVILTFLVGAVLSFSTSTSAQTAPSQAQPPTPLPPPAVAPAGKLEESSPGAPKAVLTTPAPGSRFTSASVTFGWTAGMGGLEYSLWIGSTGFGSSNVYAQSQALSTTSAAITVPAGGVIVYVRLLTRFASGWQYNDYAYIAAP